MPEQDREETEARLFQQAFDAGVRAASRQQEKSLLDRCGLPGGILLALGGGSAFGAFMGALGSLGGTNTETGEPRIPSEVAVDSFLERVVWGAGAGAGAMIVGILRVGATVFVFGRTLLSRSR